jgi:hypothetical protein
LPIEGNKDVAMVRMKESDKSWTPERLVEEHSLAVEALAAAIHAASRAYFAVLNERSCPSWDGVSPGVKMMIMANVCERLLGQRSMVDCVGNALEAGIVAAIAQADFDVVPKRSKALEMGILRLQAEIEDRLPRWSGLKDQPPQTPGRYVLASFISENEALLRALGEVPITDEAKEDGV